MSETFADDPGSETADGQLMQQPIVDMGTPIDLFSTTLRLVGEEDGVGSAGVPPLLCLQGQRPETGKLRPVDSMPQLTPMTSGGFSDEKTDVHTEGWVPVVRQPVFFVKQVA